MARFDESAAAEVSHTDAVLPAQFWNGHNHGADPERRLMAAVLEDAIALCVRSIASRDATLARDAEEADQWLSSDERVGPFAFASICDALDLDADAVREAIARLRGRRAAFVRPRSSSGRGRHQILQKRLRPNRAA